MSQTMLRDDDIQWLADFARRNQADGIKLIQQHLDLNDRAERKLFGLCKTKARELEI